jgi:hypothetical protein
VGPLIRVPDNLAEAEAGGPICRAGLGLLSTLIVRLSASKYLDAMRHIHGGAQRGNPPYNDDAYRATALLERRNAFPKTRNGRREYESARLAFHLGSGVPVGCKT